MCVNVFMCLRVHVKLHSGRKHIAIENTAILIP